MTTCMGTFYAWEKDDIATVAFFLFVLSFFLSNGEWGTKPNLVLK